MSTLSEQVRELEAERDRLRVQYDIAQRVVKHEESLRIAAESRLAQARAEGARDGFVDGANWLHGEVHRLGLYRDGVGVPGPGGVVRVMGRSSRDEARDRYPAPSASAEPVTPSAPEPSVTLSDGRVVEWTLWEYRNGVECARKTLDLVTNKNKTGCESHQCFESLAELREKVLLPWRDWVRIDAVFAPADARRIVAMAAPEGR